MPAVAILTPAELSAIIADSTRQAVTKVLAEIESNKPEVYYSKNQARKILKISPNTLDKIIKLGDITQQPNGKISKSDLNQFLKNRQ